MQEHELQKRIQVALSGAGCVVFRTNVGRGLLIRRAQIIKRYDNGTALVAGTFNYFDSGLPVGHPDLYGFRKKDGKVFYIEVKTASGVISEKQKKFHEMLHKNGIIHGVARSVDDAVKIVEEGAVGYGYK